MIAVVADDLTGAAELAGIGLNYGLNVELTTAVDTQSKADLLVVATDARSVSEPEAVLQMTEVSRALRTLKPSLVYKKIDSVLRGHVLAETRAQLAIFGLSKALLIPANPALGRTLINGQYYVQGELIHQTHFSEDPEFPVTESDVVKRFQDNAEKLVVQPHQTDLPKRGIIIGEVETPADLIAWTRRIDDDTLPGGGSGFFAELLAARYVTKRIENESVTLRNQCLYVCGTAFGESVTLVRRAAERGHLVQYLPASLMRATYQTDDIMRWTDDVTADLQRNKPVIIAVDPASVSGGSRLAFHLRSVMAKAVATVLNQAVVNELIIEGGSTASAILREIDVTRLRPMQELAPGVVRSAAIGRNKLHITMKPGSYRWSPDLWPFP